MRTYGTVHTRFWIGESAGCMNDKQKLLYLYLLTSPHSNPIGCYRLPLAYIESDLKWSSETVKRTVTETVSIGLIEYDFSLEIVLVNRFMEFNPIANPNVAKSCMLFIETISKKSVVYQSLIESMKPYTERFPNGYINGLANGMPNREPILNQTNHDPKPDPKPEPPVSNFSEFYEIFPKHEGRADAEKSYSKAIKQGASHEIIVAGVRKYAEHIKRNQTIGKYISQPATWLNGKRWDDELTPDGYNAKSGGGGSIIGNAARNQAAADEVRAEFGIQTGSNQ